MHKSYFEILEVDGSSNLNDIKKAFRKKAKLYHPDLNKAEDANEKFIQINEAYEFFLRFFQKYDKQGAKYPGSQQKDNCNSGEKQARDYSSYYRAYDKFYKSWFEKGQYKAKQRAEYYAQKEYEEFKKSRLYKTASALNKVFNYLYYMLGISLVVLFLILFFIISQSLIFQLLHKDGSGKAIILIGCILFSVFVFIGIWKFVKSHKFRLQTD